MKSIPELSVDSRLLHQRLEKVAQGEIVTYAELSSLIGRDVQTDAYSNLMRARIKAQKNLFVFEPVINVGLKRLTDMEIPGLGDQMTSRIHGISRRTIRKLSCIIHFESLSRDLQTKQNAALSLAGMLNFVTRSSQVKKLESKIEEVTGELPVARTLELFQKGK